MINQETYFALSTPGGRSATATIRISGPHSKNTILKLFKNKNKNLNTPLNHELNQITELKGAVSQLSSSIEERLGNFGTSIGNSLTQQTQNTQKSLMEMHERLAIIDRAQENIHSLSTQVNDLQNILSNKQLRGAFGEVQLENIVKDALPQNAYQFQYTLISNTRVDCIVKMPQPPGSICIDSKFPLEDYKKFANSSNEQEKKDNLKSFHNAVQKHIKDIADKYISPGETADSAIMFLPSESIYSEINIRFPRLVNESRNKKVYMAGPDNLMLLLHTVRAILRDATMSQTAGKIQIEVDKLTNDLNLFIEKPTPEQVQQNLDSSNKIRVSMNIFKFSGEIFKFLENCPLNPIRKEKELPTAIMNMINESSSYMKGIAIAEHVPDLTSKSDIHTINKLFV